MKWWPPWRRRPGCPSEEARQSVEEAARAVKDARVQREIAAETHERAIRSAARLQETRRRNHFGEAVARSMRRA